MLGSIPGQPWFMGYPTDATSISNCTQQYQELMAILSTINPLHEGPTNRLMIHNNSKPTTAGFYEVFSEHGMRGPPAKWIWLPPILNKHKFFLCLAFLGRLNRRDNTAAKTVTTNAGCYLCPALESTDHIILHCKMSMGVGRNGPQPHHC
jgi:hypothetical protein